jgi:hypothetical protein
MAGGNFLTSSVTVLVAGMIFRFPLITQQMKVSLERLTISSLTGKSN